MLAKLYLLYGFMVLGGIATAQYRGMEPGSHQPD